MELILGTAEFNPKGYAGKSPIELKEIIRIIALAEEAGIETLDMADTYGLDYLLPYVPYFNHIMKSRDLSRPNCWYHYDTYEPPVSTYQASVYTIEQCKNLANVIVPMNIDNTEFVSLKVNGLKYARSILDRGRLLEKGYTVKECLRFVKVQKVDGVIIGVNSEKELQQILKEWEGVTKSYENAK